MSRRENAGILGIGAVACAACCAGPILAFLGGLAAISLGAAVLVGSVGLAIATAALLAFIAWRRKRSTTCDVPVSVAVAAPTRRPTRST